jgi:hypothetical protein
LFSPCKRPDSTIEEDCTCTVGSIKWLPAIKVKTAIQVNGSAVQCIIRALKMTTIKNGPLSTDQWAQIQPAYKTCISGNDFITIAKYQLRLHNGRPSFLSFQFSF